MSVHLNIYIYIYIYIYILYTLYIIITCLSHAKKLVHMNADCPLGRMGRAQTHAHEKCLLAHTCSCLPGGRGRSSLGRWASRSEASPAHGSVWRRGRRSTFCGVVRVSLAYGATYDDFLCVSMYVCLYVCMNAFALMCAYVRVYVRMSKRAPWGLYTLAGAAGKCQCASPLGN